MTSKSFLAALLLLAVVATSMRFAWLRSDPPVAGSVGIVWHDEGAWVHNARNRALFGEWRTDNWNPVFIAPVFTALEYASFEAFGVGTWQARVVPAISGLVAVLFLMVGLSAIAGRQVALLGGSLLALNYAFVMWNRAALMESTMTMWMVVAWGAFARADRRHLWAVVAGLAAVAAWFTKASAAFFIGALALEALACIAGGWLARRPSHAARRTSHVLVLSSLVFGFVAVGVAFVLPNWAEYSFYNWHMTVTRKPDYTVGAFIDRATWIPIVQSVFSRMWCELTLGAIGFLTVVARWRTARPAERLLVIWIALGLAELVVHDSGNERRYVMFIPAFIALAALFVGRLSSQRPSAGRGIDAGPGARIEVGAGERGFGQPALPLALALIVAASAAALTFVVAGSALRPVFLESINAGLLKTPVRFAVAIALGAGLLALARQRSLIAWLSAPRLPRALAYGLLGAAGAMQAWQFALFAAHRAEINYAAAAAIGRELPAGTLVQGKLANGLALESRIRPLFVGNGFGNFADRLERDDARYILTYDLPRIGYESSDGSGLIQGILEHYPRHRIVDAFVVDETPLPDRAVLIEKEPDGLAGHARD